MAAEEVDESLFGPTNRKVLTDPFLENNPITVQVLGICSSLAVTAKMQPALIMGLSVMVVVAGSNLVISLLRNMIPKKVRIIAYMVVASTLVICVDQLLQAYSYEVSKQLSVFVGLIITNCIVMGRMEAYAMSHKPAPSFLDGIGNGLGYGSILLIVGFFREFLGSGKLFGHAVLPQGIYADNGGFYDNNGLMVLAPGAFILLAMIIWVQRTFNVKAQEKS